MPHKLIEDKSKTLILIDGQNVALRHREEQFSSKALKIIGEFWTKKGYPFHILLPDFCFNKETIAKKRELAVKLKFIIFNLF